MKILISDIKISRPRLRVDDGDLEELATSFLKHGQLQPIVIDRTYELAAGWRRLCAAKLNGWTEIKAEYTDALSELDLREIELEENIARKDMTWQERVKSVAELDRLRRLKDPNWTQEQTAAVAGLQRTRVTEALKLDKMMKLFPELAEAKDIAQAKNWAEAKAQLVTRRVAVDANPVFTDIDSKLVLGDSVEVIKLVPDESFHAVITDPPFGVDYDKRTEGQSGQLSSYEDGEVSYLRLLSMAPDLYRVVKPNGWLIWFCGISWYERARDAFRVAGFTVDEIPLVWDRSGGRTFTSRPDRYFTRGYDIALHCLKGSPQLVQRGKSNIIRIDPVSQSERELLVERPVELYCELIRRLTVPGEIVADFFTGSGSCLAAAASLQRDFWGCELSAERRAFALQKIQQYIPTVEK